MKKVSTLLTLLLVGAISACNQNPTNSTSSSESGQDSSSSVVEELTKEEIVLNELKKNSYEAEMVEDLKILRPNDKYAVDIVQHYEKEYGFYYQEGTNNISASTRMYGFYADLDKKTGEVNQNTVREATTPLQVLYKDNETGYALLKSISLENEIVVQVAATQDGTTGEVIPLIYDDNFKNPFDYITLRDLTYVEENNIVEIKNDKIDFILNAFGAVGVNDIIESAHIVLDDNYLPTKIVTNIPDEVASTYTRTNSIEITFTNLDAQYFEVRPYEHNNPELAEALLKNKDATNFTYNKNYIKDGVSVNHITGFFTEDLIYFHHGYADDGHVYKNGDDYDYIAKRNNEDGAYYVYDCTTNDGENFFWGIVMASETMPLSYKTFYECGPTYHHISASIFKKVGDNKYEIESELIKTAGQYFDYGVWGVDSAAAESNTNKLIITLNDDNTIKLVEMGFITGGQQFDVEYYYENIGTTTIPSWLEFNA